MDQTAADLNNVAVAYLEGGHLRKALEHFRNALRMTMGDLRPPPPHLPPPLPSQQRYDAGTGGGAARRGEPTWLQQQQRQPYDSKQSELSSPGTPFIHAKGFGIVGAPGSYSPDPLINTTVISTIVIFNLALVYHIKGLHEKALTDARLHKAHSLYTKAYLLLNDAGVTFGSTGNAVVDLLSMAVSNNLAQVSYELLSYEESRAHFDSLIRFALTVVPGRYEDQYVGSVMDQQKSNFLLNAIILHAPNLAPAA
jgi:tetratricopeptide (TPR) repeat protein